LTVNVKQPRIKFKVQKQMIQSRVFEFKGFLIKKKVPYEMTQSLVSKFKKLVIQNKAL